MNKKNKKIPIEIRSGAINDTLMIFIHLKEGAILAPGLSELQQKRKHLFDIKKVNRKSVIPKSTILLKLRR